MLVVLAQFANKRTRTQTDVTRAVCADATLNTRIKGDADLDAAATHLKRLLLQRRRVGIHPLSYLFIVFLFRFPVDLIILLVLGFDHFFPVVAGERMATFSAWVVYTEGF